jgi:hypothetical protein
VRTTAEPGAPGLTLAATTPLSVPARLAAPAAAAAAGLAAVALLAVRDPHRTGSYGSCPFLALTGRPCPLCGGLRAVSDLVHGHLLAALQSNGLAVAVLLGGAGLWAGWVTRRLRGHGREAPPMTSDPRLGRVVAVVMIAFCVLRWLPGLAVLGPS